MSKQIASIPLERVKRVQIYVNKGQKTLTQIQSETGANYIINGGLYDMVRQRANCHLKVDGHTLAQDPYCYWGYAWDAGPDIAIRLVPAVDKANYICCSCLLLSGQPQKLIYDAAMGGARPRTAVGLKDGALMLFCCSDGMTPEGLRDYLHGQGWDSAVMLDGGGSSQCWFDGTAPVTSTRKVHNLILVYMTDEKKEENKPMGNYKVTATIGLNIRAGADKSAAKLGGYSYGEVVTVLEERSGWARTAKGWVSMAWLEPVRVRVTDNGVVIAQEMIPVGRQNRPGKANPRRYITVHETGNRARTADAVAHGVYLKGDAAASKPVSWHYTVDDHAIVQHLPDGEAAYHATDGAAGPGNATSIGIEICVNESGDFERAKANAAALIRLLMEEHGISLDHVVQHHHWYNKDCPQTIRNTSGAWEAFLTLCGGEDVGQWGDKEVAKAVAKGVIQGDENGVVRADEPMTLRQWCILADRLGLLD